MKKFKIILIIVLMSFLMGFSGSESSYCEGWESGYKEGWCYERANCLAPIVPLCPLATLNCSKGYKCGYNRGFSKALSDRN